MSELKEIMGGVVDQMKELNDAATKLAQTAEGQNETICDLIDFSMLCMTGVQRLMAWSLKMESRIEALEAKVEQ